MANTGGDMRFKQLKRKKILFNINATVVQQLDAYAHNDRWINSRNELVEKILQKWLDEKALGKREPWDLEPEVLKNGTTD